MHRKSWIQCGLGVSLCAILIFAPLTASAVTIPTVWVRNPGNAGEVQYEGTFGAVQYTYHIGRTEVTNEQYAEFLNAKAASDPLGLYNDQMASDWRTGGITRSGSSGSYTYATKPNWGNKPVNYVSWYDAIRFANWLHNGQGAGDTETGAYTLLGGTPTPSNRLSITRNAGATWFLPSENEWYKSAYHQPGLQGGDSDDYWLYPTRNNSPPALVTSNAVGDIKYPGENVANYNYGYHWEPGVSKVWNGYVTTVGSAGPLSDSYYGTADQGGNVAEWNETSISMQGITGYRGIRGGSYVGWPGTFGGGDPRQLQSSDRGFAFMETFGDALGFRVATDREPTKPGDANFDGLVDGADYTIWADNYLQTDQSWGDGDFTGDGIVDGSDYTVWADNYAPAAAAASAIPEPSTIVLAGIGGLAIVAFARRRIR